MGYALIEKRKPIRSKKILAAANGEACTLCGCENDGTVVFCHLNVLWAGKGLRQKADDIAGFFGCYECHEAYDRMEDAKCGYADWEIMRAMYRTWRRLWERGIIGEK